MTENEKLHQLVILKRTYIDPRGNAHYPKQYYYGELPPAIRDNPDFVSIVENLTTQVSVITTPAPIATDLNINKTTTGVETITPNYTKVDYFDPTQPKKEIPVAVPDPVVQKIEVKEITSPDVKVVGDEKTKRRS